MEDEDLPARIQAAVRRLIADSVLFNHAVTARVGLNSSDSQFLTLLQVHGPMTPGRLARISGLTTGTVTGVLDRLERAGFARRTRDPADRRKVVVALDEGAVAERLMPLYRGQAEWLDTVLAAYDPGELRLIAGFLERLLAGPSPAGDAFPPPGVMPPAAG